LIVCRQQSHRSIRKEATMNAKQLCVVSIAVAATFAAVAPIASATSDRVAVRAAHAIGTRGDPRESRAWHEWIPSLEGLAPTEMRGSAQRRAVGLSWWWRWY
jgi:hypothetical protein